MTKTMLANKVKKRDISVDIVKAIGIICMVAGHCDSPITKFIYLFHMAIFFIASGYCFNVSKSDSYDSMLKFIKSKFKTLWFPYVLWTTIFSLLNNLFIRINVYTDNPLLFKYASGKFIVTTLHWSINDILRNIAKSFLLHGATQIGSAFWFLATLMELSIVYCVVDFTIKNILHISDTIRIQFLISVFFLNIGFLCYIFGHSFYGIDRVFSNYILFHGGIVLKRYHISDKTRTEIQHFCICVSTLIVLLVCNNVGKIALDQNSYVNPVFFLIVSFSGWQFLYEIAHYIMKSNSLKNLFTCIGRNTLSVVILHFLSFKIVSYIGVLINKQPLCIVAAFPVLYSDGLWWIAYLIVGLAVPICLNLLWKEKIKKLLLNII